jgi:hypothetical protein
MFVPQGVYLTLVTQTIGPAERPDESKFASSGPDRPGRPDRGGTDATSCTTRA